MNYLQSTTKRIVLLSVAAGTTIGTAGNYFYSTFTLPTVVAVAPPHNTGDQHQMPETGSTKAIIVEFLALCSSLPITKRKVAYLAMLAAAPILLSKLYRYSVTRGARREEAMAFDPEGGGLMVSETPDESRFTAAERKIRREERKKEKRYEGTVEAARGSSSYVETLSSDTDDEGS